MKFVVFPLFAILATPVVHGQDELPISEQDVFIQSGELSDTSIIIMARCNSEVDSAVTLEVSPSGGTPITMEGQVYAARDYTISFEVNGLVPKTEHKYSVSCSSLADDSVSSANTNGSFNTLPGPEDTKSLSFVWCADLAGQGWGRNPNMSVENVVTGETVTGGYIVFDTMAKMNPDFALFQGDMIYADNAIPPIKAIPESFNGGGNWTNNPSKDFIAVTLDEFRDNWKYNFGDEKMQNFLERTPVFVQWDDHEVTNNWWPKEIMGEPLYDNGTAVNGMFANSLQAFYEFNPIIENSLIYRKQQFNKHIEIFFVDYRSYRDPNPDNTSPEGAAMMGKEQLDWLIEGLKSSTATWKIISSHDPFGIVTGGSGDYDAFGNEDAAILGREFEFKTLLETIESNNIANVISLTSDVHFTAHVSMDPARAEGGFSDYKVLDEFVIGPIHAGSFGPNFLDTSFGPSYLFELGPLTLGYERWANLPPSEIRLQSFGHAEVKEDGRLAIKLIGIDGTVQYEKILTPEEGVSPPPPPSNDCKTIAEIACEDSDFSTLCSLVTSSDDIFSLLDDPSQTLTVFAPINDAFEVAPSIGVGEIDDLLAFHTVAGEGLVKSNLICKETIKMANGKDSRTTCDDNRNPGRFFQRGADNVDSALPEIVEADIMACNGVLHAVDNVMLPSGFFPDISPSRGGN